MTLMPTVSLLVIAFATSLAAQAPGSSDAADARHGIQAGNAAYIAAFSRADARALSQVYDADGARLNDGGEVVQGRSAIAADVGKFVARTGPVRVTLETKEVWNLKDTAYETGIWSYTFQPKGASERRIGGHYVTVWKRQPGGGWKILADMGVPGT
jgi:uncharacterized protein (TIGR02246 family)